jgi:hypothetical protein
MVKMRFAIALVGLIAIVALVRGGADGQSAEELAVLTEQIAAMHDALADEKQARAALEEEFGRLRAELAWAGPPIRTAPAPPQSAAPAPTPVPERLAEAGERRSAAFDPQRLAESGLSSSEVERFRARVSAIELERLYLRDQAQREGWLDSPRFAVESGRIDEELAGLRDEFDEGLYDWMLFAEGRPNRVTVTEVLTGSAADLAGVRPGDLIERYDERLVLAPEELGAATSAGQSGSQVEIVLQRDGETLRVFLPRGPIGVKLEPRSIAPSPVG